MQNFLSTLAQITATLLTVFLASLTAYFVFLQERSTHFADSIESTKFEIRDRLIQLRTSWPWTLTFYLPPDFWGTYRSRHTDKSGAGLVMQAATDLAFQHPAMAETIDGIRSEGLPDGPWRGRVYFVVLTEAVSAVTVGTPDARISPEGIFPSSIEGPGFEQWRATFQKLRGAFTLLGIVKQDMKTDFRTFVSILPPAYQVNSAGLEPRYVSAVDEFFDTLNFLKSKTDEIDKQHISMRRYSFSFRVNLPSIVVVSALAFVLGVVVPMGLLVWPGPSVTPITGFALLAVTLILVLASFAQFGHDVFRAPQVDWSEYVAARWYRPMLKEIERLRSNLDEGGLLDLEFLDDARISEDQSRFSPRVVKALAEYLEDAQAYNKIAVKFNARVVQAIREHAAVAVLASGAQETQGGFVMHPYSLLNDQKYSSFREALDKSIHGPDATRKEITVEVLMPRWSHVEVRIPLAALGGNPDLLTKPLEEIRTAIKGDELSGRFLEATGKTRVSAESLKAALEAASSSTVQAPAGSNR